MTTTERMTTFDATMIMDGAWDMTGYEESEENFLAAAQALVDTGIAWQLQGRVGRTCAQLISEGWIDAASV